MSHDQSHFQYTAEQFNSKMLYDPGIQILIQEEDRTVFRMANETGEGIITRYPVFPGIELLYNDIHMSDAMSSNKLPRQDIMEINHCREGRFECAFPDGRTAYLRAGDLAVNMLSNRTSGNWFPLSHYHGISVVLDLSEAVRTLAEISASFGDMPLDPYRIRDHLCRQNTCCIMRATDSIQHIFAELYTAPEVLRNHYFKLKILELLLFLSMTESPRQGNRRYFAPTQVESIRAIHDYLVSHLDRQVTLAELSKRFEIPLTSMKLCFKSVYGDSIHAYMQTYRMQKATSLLIRTDGRVTDIAARLGYKNASKFSEVFKQTFGTSPSNYRKTFCPNGVSFD